jgi:lipoic acid synthetase
MNYVPKSTTKRFPSWIRTQINTGNNRQDLGDMLSGLSLNTVCQSAQCPNLNECWNNKAATLMILGNRCTRQCQFCAIESFQPEAPDPDEPEKVARAVNEMGLRYVVLTSVDRDDLPDKGAGHWVKTIQALKSMKSDLKIEILTPDFKGREELIHKVVKAGPIVFNHNLETCSRLTPVIRSGNRYERSLNVLATARQYAPADKMAIKSGIMIGLGETNAEVEDCLKDLLSAGVDILTIGQYLRPSRQHWPVDRYVNPAQFDEFSALAYSMGFKAVASSPMVRSSYKSEELAIKAGV